MCGDSHLPPAPESNDLIAIIRPVSNSLCIPQPLPPLSATLSRTNSISSTTSKTSSTSPIEPMPSSISGRLRLSNHHLGTTTSEFFHDDSSSASRYGLLNVRIHRYGSPLLFGGGNPVVHEFGMGGLNKGSSSIRLDLGVGGQGVVGRTVSIVDCEERVLGEGIIGRI